LTVYDATTLASEPRKNASVRPVDSSNGPSNPPRTTGCANVSTRSTTTLTDAEAVPASHEGFWAAADELMRGLHKLQPKATKALIKPDGSTCCTESETADVFGAHFRKLYEATGTHEPSVLELLRNSPVSHDLDAEPTLEEVRTALRSLSAGRAPGASTVAPDAYLCLSDDAAGMQLFYDTVLDFWWSNDSFADVYGTGVLRVLPKKGDLSNPGNYRGIMPPERTPPGA